jgi:molybdate transport system substrate-binding protein
VRRRPRAAALLLTTVVALAALAACSDGGGGKAHPGPAAGTPVPSGKITVFAAASLTDSFKEIRDAFVRKFPGTEVEFQFAGSPTLRTQLEQGARADIYASADQANMAQALAAGAVRDSGRVFARNSLVIVTPRNNPGKITAPADLKKSGLKIVLAAPEVPAGNYARQSLALMEKDPAYGAGFREAVLKNVVSNESNVKQVLAKVQLGEADAGIVYGTDAAGEVADDVARLEIPRALNVTADYPIAVTRGASNTVTAAAFVDFVLSAEGQAILRKYGFEGAG